MNECRRITSRSIRVARVALGLALLLAPRHAAASTTWQERSDKAVEVGGLKGVTVENARGTVTVEPSGDGRLHLSALKIVRSATREHAARISRDTRVETEERAGRFVVRVRYPQREAVRVGFWEMFSGFELPRVEVRLEIQVPGGMPVDLASTSGDLTTDELAGDQTLHTTSGDISVRSARGGVTATSTSGDIEAKEVGRCRLETVSGDLTVEGARGAIDLATTSGEVSVRGPQDSVAAVTVSGDVHVTEARRGLAVRSTSGDVVAGSASGTVRVESSSGDVQVGLDGPLSRADIMTASGDVHVSLLRSLDCTLEMRTASGTIDVGVPLEVKTVTRHLVRGVVRRGTVPVVLRSSSGDIDVKSGGN